MCYQGQGVKQDFGEAVRLYRKAADRGDADAQFNLGTMYDQGEGVKQDFGEAARLFREAADQGDANAQCSLGFMYDQGQGVKQDLARLCACTERRPTKAMPTLSTTSAACTPKVKE